SGSHQHGTTRRGSGKDDGGTTRRGATELLDRPHSGDDVPDAGNRGHASTGAAIPALVALARRSTGPGEPRPGGTCERAARGDHPSEAVSTALTNLRPEDHRAIRTEVDARPDADDVAAIRGIADPRQQTRLLERRVPEEHAVR